MSEDTEKTQTEEIKEILPVLPLRDVVVYPRMIVPIFVGRDKSIEAVQKANDRGLNLVLVMQKKAETEYDEFNKTQKIVSDFDKEVSLFLGDKEES